MSEIWQNITQTHYISPHKIKEIRRKSHEEERIRISFE
jgi:hypothetical protein